MKNKAKIKGLLAGVLAVSMLGSAAVAADSAPAPVGEPIPISAVISAKESIYQPVTGKVTMVTPYYNNDGSEAEGVYYVRLDLGDDGEATFVVNKDTAMLTDGEVKEGDTFTGYFDRNRPMIMIYPPQYTAVAAAVNLDEGTVLKVAVLDSELVSDDGLVKLELTEDSAVTTRQGGQEYKSGLNGAHVAFLYKPGEEADGVTAANAEVVRVLKRDVAKPEYNEDTLSYVTEGIKDANIAVLNEILDCPAPFTTEDGIIMVPVRAISEKLGLEVEWHNDIRGVTVGDIAFVIGTDSYTVDGTVITLGTAPVLKNGSTFVPMNFFKDVVGAGSAYFFEAQVVIDWENLND